MSYLNGREPFDKFGKIVTSLSDFITSEKDSPVMQGHMFWGTEVSTEESFHCRLITSSHYRFLRNYIIREIWMVIVK